MIGLVLTAGGARGAYQAGVLKRLGEIRPLRSGPSPFPIVTGASAGAINGSLVAARSARFADATREIARVWSALRFEDVIRTDLLALARGAAGLAVDLLLGGLLGRTVSRGIFDTAPLVALLERSFPARGIGDGIRRGHVYAVALSATSYHSGRSYTFVQGRPGHPVWARARRVVVPTVLRHEHVAASSAIPIVFPPVRIATKEGGLWFGDGALRLVTPLSPAIRLGATHLFGVGVRSGRAAELLALHEREGVRGGDALASPPLAQVCGVFMNAIFLDHLDADLDHLLRMNELVRSGIRPEPLAPGGAEPMRVVTPLAVQPSEDLALVAQHFAHRMPRLVRYALEGLGRPDAESADLMSYLLFDGAYTGALIEIGYKDADQRASEIEEFLEEAGAFARAARPAARKRAAAAAPAP